ncbi:unnamed protein product [Rotaria sp. Silwood1]|nr:unnamed protein product [Rotaria sp. Silwood1]CAF1132746.1 unnamed protein product [Rotaria sp. Silwood1]CAF1215342.1 unnamed protein product [Rotaria sp. Silwood1]CAF3450598.1 unnamed protein product [Rotaria sp. Silwood1]CAF3504778.1 unnamed protein product [Rotaria sp. Silwood1]
MSFAIDKILISLGFMLLFTLLIGACTGLAVDATYPDLFRHLNEDRNSGDDIHYLAKRRFLPTRRELYRYVNDDFSNEDNDEDSNLNRKQYFLKSTRYFPNRKRDNVRFPF